RFLLTTSSKCLLFAASYDCRSVPRYLPLVYTVRGASLDTTLGNAIPGGQKNTSQRANRSTVVSTLPLARHYAQQHRPKCAAEDGSTYGTLGCLITPRYHYQEAAVGASLDATLIITSQPHCGRRTRRLAVDNVVLLATAPVVQIGASLNPLRQSHAEER
ncbi:hypothetical protein L914_13351, partial [Phytophthora nicotianae]